MVWTFRVRDGRGAPALAIAAMLAVSACATGRSDDPATVEANDPYEDVNRAIFGFNDGVDRVLIRPVAIAYRTVVPPPLQTNVRSFLRNLREPLNIANNVLQGDADGAGRSLERFFVNSTVGLAGLNDIAVEVSPERLAYVGEDFGQTLAVWGMDEGPYLVLPLFGPSNPRDTLGLIVDNLADPTTWVLGAYDLEAVNYGLIGLRIVDARAATVDATDELEASSVDYYVTLRSLYRQSRAAAINDGVTSEDIDIPDFDDAPPDTPSP
jgi:phospholipid-binding lipoprotein MlaA